MDAKHIAFTGTQNGMTPQQAEAFRDVLGWGNHVDHFLHHGDCIGADIDAHRIALARGWRIHVHPPDDPRKRAFCAGAVIHAPLPYLVRNRVIVDSAELLVATPSGPEKLRSGTWATIRYAIKRGKPVWIVWPHGEVEPNGASRNA